MKKLSSLLYAAPQANVFIRCTYFVGTPSPQFLRCPFYVAFSLFGPISTAIEMLDLYQHDIWRLWLTIMLKFQCLSTKPCTSDAKLAVT